MSTCNITLNLNGVTKTFTSDEALDQFLAGHASELEGLSKKYRLKTWDKIFSMSEEQDTAVQKIIEIKKAFEAIPKRKFKVSKQVYNGESFEDVEDTDFTESIIDSIGVTKYIETFGHGRDFNKQTITKVNDDYQNFFKDNLRNQGFSEEAIEKAWKVQEQKATMTKQMGEDIHYLLETKIKQINDDSVKLDLTKLKVLKEDNLVGILPKIDNFVNKLKAKYPDAQYFTEVPIISKHLPSSIVNSMELHNVKANTINGRIDLLIIDNNGIAHIMDWKTSARRVGNWAEMNNKILSKNGFWSSAKKIKGFAQLGNYSAMLEQYGLTVGSAELVPIYLDFVKKEDGSYKNEIAEFEFDNPEDTNSTQVSYVTKYMRFSEYLFGVTTPIEIKELKKTGEILTKIFPGTNIGEEQIRHFQASVDYYKNKPNFIKNVAQGTKDYEKGFRYKFYKNNLPNNPVVLCKTKEDLDTELTKYVKELNDYMDTQMVNFGKDLSNVLYTQGDSSDAMEKWLATFSEDSKTFLKNTFRKYYRRGWQLTANKELTQNGIFIFKKGSQIDIVAIGTKDLHHIHSITHTSGKTTHTVAGAKLLDSDKGADPYKIMSSQYGNLILMKIASILSENRSILEGAKINDIKVINPWHQSEVSYQSREYFVNSWNTIARLNQLKLLDIRGFYNDIDVAYHNASDAILSTDLANEVFKETLTLDGSQSYYNQKMIRQYMRDIRFKYNNDYKNVQTPAGYAYIQLQKALLLSIGVHPFDEPDRGQYFNYGIWPTGTFINAAGQSFSQNGRVLDELFAGYRDLYTDIFNEYINKFRKLRDAVYKEWNFNERTDNPRELWANFFESDSNGNLDPRWVLKRPTNSIFNNKPKSKEFIQYITACWAKYRFPTADEEELDRLYDTDEYWEVPLLEANLSQAISQTFKKDGIKGVANGLWRKIKDTGAKLENYYSGENEYADTHTDTTGEGDVVYNKYLDMDRELRDRLTTDPSRAWTTDLGSIFSMSIAQASISDASRTYGPIFLAFKALIEYGASVGKNDYPELIEYIEKYVKNKVFLKQLMSHKFDTVYALVSSLKSLSSKIALGANFRNFTKEMITQAYITATRSATGQIPDVNTENFFKAFAYVVKQVPTSLTHQNFMTFLNQRYAMSDYSITNMGEYFRRERWGIRNLESGDLFIGTKLPDDYFRLTILVAKMMQDGCFDAYVQDGDTWKYDMKKDKRFSKYLNDDHSNEKEYEAQERLYLDYLKSWQQSRPDLELERGDMLPDAYPPKIKSSIRQEAGNLYGFFDREDKSLISATFLGSMFMQYKTWLSAKINQWMRSPGFVNIWQRHHVTDENGKKLYLVYASEDEINSGQDIVRTITEDDPNLDQYLSEDRAVAWIIEEGTFQEGMLQASGAFLHDLLTWDLDTFKMHWEDPILRGQLMNGLMDTLGLLLFAGLINILFGEDVVKNKKEQNWVTQWSYGVLTGFAKDGPLHQVLGSMVTDLNPPSLIAIQQWAQAADSVLSGRKSIAQGTIEQIGALREFRGMFYAVT